MWFLVKINCSVCVHGIEGTCHPMQHCGSIYFLEYFHCWSSYVGFVDNKGKKRISSDLPFNYGHNVNPLENIRFTLHMK